MKKAILITALALISAATFAQTKKDTVKVKPVYEKFYKVSPDLYEQFLTVTHQYRDVVIYNPSLSADQKISTQKNIDAGFYSLRGLKLDSAEITTKK